MNDNKFVVFDETLDSSAETIAGSQSILAIAGLINIPTVVWRSRRSRGGSGDCDIIA